MVARERGIVALDVPSLEQALELVNHLGDTVGWYKVGLELFTAAGPRALTALGERGKQIFLDLKLHDIPNTVGRAAAAASGTGADLLTVHAAGGPDMIRAAVEAAPTCRILAVTALTSLDARKLPAHFRRDLPLEEIVLALTEEALGAGAAGVVLAGAEVAKVKSRFGARCLCVVPGVRPPDAARDDQARTVTPGEALRAGADFLVIGRAVTAAHVPLAAWGELWAGV